jgi:hypothetical protein
LPAKCNENFDGDLKTDEEHIAATANRQKNNIRSVESTNDNFIYWSR